MNHFLIYSIENNLIKKCAIEAVLKESILMIETIYKKSSADHYCETLLTLFLCNIVPVIKRKQIAQVTLVPHIEISS